MDARIVALGVSCWIAGAAELMAQEQPPPAAPFQATPVTELGQQSYTDSAGRVYAGGLYPNGANKRPAAHDAAGRALAAAIQPLDPNGQPDATHGRIVLLSIGLSNTTMEFASFKRLADSQPGKNPRLVLVDGAQGGAAARFISDPVQPLYPIYWSGVAGSLLARAVTAQQVQVVWLKETNPIRWTGEPTFVADLQSQLRLIVQDLHRRFPNLRLVFLSSRIYAGYASTEMNPEPYAYESAFAVKGLIEQQIVAADPGLRFDGDAAAAPWLAWGPYLWASGQTPRADGMTWRPEEFAADGTHPSAVGARKVARHLWYFFANDPCARRWFLAPDASTDLDRDAALASGY